MQESEIIDKTRRTNLQCNFKLSNKQQSKLGNGLLDRHPRCRLRAVKYYNDNERRVGIPNEKDSALMSQHSARI